MTPGTEQSLKPNLRSESVDTQPSLEKRLQLLDTARKPHRYLLHFARQLSKIEVFWQHLQKHDAVEDVAAQLNQLLRKELAIAQQQKLNALAGLLAEMETIMLSLGRADSTQFATVSRYMSSCINSLYKTLLHLVEQALETMGSVPDKPPSTVANLKAPRIYILDEENNLIKDLAIDLKGQGFKVFPVTSWRELKRLYALQAPRATLVVLNKGADSINVLPELRAIVADQAEVPCYVLAEQDSPEQRMLVAASGANSFLSLPCYMPALAAELHGLEKASLRNSMKLLVAADSQSAFTQQLKQSLPESLATLLFCEDLSQLSFIAKDKKVDGLVVIDNGESTKLVNCMAIVGQDAFLKDIPMTVILKHNYSYDEQLVRLLNVEALDIYEQPLDADLLVLKLQSRTLQYRRKRFKQKYLSIIDSESGFMLRQPFYQEVELRTAENLKKNLPSALIYLRLDNLRDMMLSVGVGNLPELKRQLAHVLVSIISPEDRVTMISDDEFLIFANREALGDFRQLQIHIKQQLESFSKHRVAESSLSVQVGIALLRDTRILKAAHQAIDTVKLQTETVNTKLQAPVVEKTEPAIDINKQLYLAKKLKQALNEERLRLVFQPIVSMHADGVERYEVLLRLEEDGCLISPSDFLDAETPANVLRFLDRWVINQSLKVLRQTESEYRQLKLFIKIHAITMTDHKFMGWLEKVFNAAGGISERCVFELKQTAAIEHLAESQGLVNFVRDHGAFVCIEEFDSQVKALNLLDCLEIDYLKFKKGCLGAESGDVGSQQLTAVLDKAKQLDVNLLAGFIEDTSNLSLAIRNGVALFQGYFLQPPAETMEFDFSMAM